MCASLRNSKVARLSLLSTVFHCKDNKSSVKYVPQRFKFGWGLQHWRRSHGFESCWSPEIFFPAKICNCLNYDYNCDDHISISSVFTQFKLISFHVSFLLRVKMNSLNWSAPYIWVFIAQLVQHCSANAEAMDSNPVEALVRFSTLSRGWSTFPEPSLRKPWKGYFFRLKVAVA